MENSALTAYLADIKRQRKYLPEAFEISNWEELKPFFDELIERELKNADEFITWLKDLSEIESVIQEELGRRYIKMTCFTDNKSYRESFELMITEIEPKLAPVSNELNKRIADSPYISQVDLPGLDVMVRGIKTSLDLYRQENIPLQTKVQQLQSKYGEISGGLGVDYKDKELTLQQASNYLQSTDRKERETVYRLISDARFKVHEQLDQLFDDMLPIRTEIARNSGFENFRDYSFKAKQRFDYSPEDCRNFHKAVANEVVPLLEKLARERKQLLGLESLRPWDLQVDKRGKAALKAFSSANDLVNKSIETFEEVDPFFADCLKTMEKIGHLDLESRKAKSPGGYNYPLDEIGVPFIFMNATQTLRDMVTMMHEGGHAVHSFLVKDLDLLSFKHPTAEVAELASMSMELLSMDHWDLFFNNEESLLRAKEEHLEQIIETLPWVAVVDKFQHWIYENEGHSVDERNAAWENIFTTFHSHHINYDGLEAYRQYAWHKQLHIFEVPFYYIEYAIAQLGAIGVWKNFRENPKKALANYKEALSLGYTKSIPEIYEAAGISFDFSSAHIKSLIEFVWKELEIVKLKLSELSGN